MDFSHLEYNVKFNCIDKKARNDKFWLGKATFSCLFSGVQIYKVQS